MISHPRYGTHKKCANCSHLNGPRPVSRFYVMKRRGKADYLQSNCKDCNTEVCRGLWQRSEGRYTARTRERRRLRRLAEVAS